MTHAIEIKNLRKQYKDSGFCLDNINISVPKSSIMGIVGKNGAGKSTAISCIFDIVKKDDGQILLYGNDLDASPGSLKNDISVVFDTLSYPEDLNAIKLERVLRDLYRDFNTDIFMHYINKFNLPKDKKFKEFSRGMTMKLAIAVALSHNAKFLVLDEATAGLDPVAREEVLDLFLDFASTDDNAILISSHITSDLERIADFITFIDDGKIILVESKDNLIYKYGIAKMTQADFSKLGSCEYIACRNRGLHIEVLVNNKDDFARSHPDLTLDSAKLDEILPLITKGQN